MPRITRKKTVRIGKVVSSIRKDIESFHKYLLAPRSDAQVKKRFKDIFGGSLSEKRIKDLLAISPQRGGMGPIDHMMAPPDVPLSAVPYVQRGFGFANIDSLTEGSPKEYLGSTPQMGGKRGTSSNKRGSLSNKRMTRSKKQRGGSLADFAAAVGAQPFLMSAPPTMLQAAARISTGQVGLPAPQPEINNLSIIREAPINTSKMLPW
uniref:Uncharacterized protein n=1 Tax=viral metagenome TaxID=1070528 RepID=A0A6C0L5S6_9ZZZZ